MNRIHHPDAAKASVKHPALAVYANQTPTREVGPALGADRASPNSHILLQHLRDHDHILTPKGKHSLKDKLKALQCTDSITPGELLNRHKCARQ